MKKIFRDCEDVKYRQFIANRRNIALIYLDGMVDTERLECTLARLLESESPLILLQDINLIVKYLLPIVPVQLTPHVPEAVSNMMRGNILLFIDGANQVIMINLVKFVKRTIEEAQRETVLRGPYDAFCETLSDNIVLIRRRTEDTHLKIRFFTVGERSKSRVVLAYIDNLVKSALVEEVECRLNNVNTDKILAAGVLEEFIIESPWSPFPQTQGTERPDKAVAALYEGRVAIMIDNTPWVLLAPCTYNLLLQSPDDYTLSTLIVSTIRFFRHLSALVTVLLPGMYIGITSYHSGLLPSALALSFAELRARSPFPSYLETLLMFALLEIFEEATARLPQKTALAASVLGGFVIGTTLVEAGIVNPLLVVVVASTAIASYTIPSYPFSKCLRWLRWPMILLASVFGLYGLVIGCLIMVTHMYALRSFGESFMGDMFDITALQDWKDMMVRLPAKLLRIRPKLFGSEDKVRSSGGND